MLGITVRAVIAAVSFVATGVSGTLAIISLNPTADAALTLIGWVIIFAIAGFAAIGFSISLSREISRLTSHHH
jgi:hypothetical protein